ncbi:hypothetical protein ABIA35_006213 [Catenulispora sp. MAP12-49]|uniref:hypothetical protein n=1 Tax=Catenulispora sp. MAP12-49 TaxID=3156302 RepID=UPI003513BB99
MAASSQESPELTAEFTMEQPVGTVRGHARILIRPTDDGAGTILRLRRYLPHVTLLRYHDCAQDGSVLGPERDAVIVPGEDPRHIECAVDLSPGAVTREYRLEWELDPDDHPAIGVGGGEMLLFRAYLMDRSEDGAEKNGAEKTWDQRRIVIRWSSPEDPSSAFDRWRFA